MNAVGIDVSKGKSVVVVMRLFGEVVAALFEAVHTEAALKDLADFLKSLPGETRAVMGVYWQILPAGSTSAPRQKDGHEKWADFALNFWHRECVCGSSEGSFAKRYQKHGYRMLSLASGLPEFPVVMGMFGVGDTLGPQLMAEIGDVQRFERK